jgi:hypothetical protein
MELANFLVERTKPSLTTTASEPEVTKTCTTIDDAADVAAIVTVSFTS